MKEIERKFLVNKVEWEKVTKSTPISIKQGYVSKSEKGVVRVRIKDTKAFLTIKSANIGIERYEFEYEIPLVEAEKMLELFCENYIEKNRYEVIYESKLWEVDEFITPKQDFFLAEIELKHVSEEFVRPPWVISEVTDQPLYFNSNLI